MSLEDRQVAMTQLSNGVRVSTVFLDLIANPGEPLPTEQWETLIRGGTHDGEGERYMTADDARAGHELWVLVAKGEITPEAIHEMREVTAS
jgi:hypothetical protein